MTRPKQKLDALEVNPPTSVAEAWGDDVLLATLLEGRPCLITKAAGGGPELWLELTFALKDGTSHRLALLMEYCDPYLVAAELQGVADALVRQVALDRGADEQQEREFVRRQRLRQKRRREQVAEQVVASGATSCDYCQRTVAFVVEGAKLCKRHAEELGVRPHGKIGAPEPDEEPES